jgi:plasmid stability protein
MHSFLYFSVMSTMTIRNVPEELVDVLKKTAKRYRRSLNQQVLVCLEEASLGQRALQNVEDDLRSIREMRAGMTPMSVKEIDAAKQDGRA